MEMTINWSELSVLQLNDLYDYYTFEANPTIAKKLVNKILNRVEILYDNPQAGPKEELLTNYPHEFRYLVEGNYKIIYWIEKQEITIAAVFDCRQNPEKINNL
jgi:plasmid stabilization system protein ParE